MARAVVATAVRGAAAGVVVVAAADDDNADSGSASPLSAQSALGA